ncbi:helix-turn-helix domain-containing protein [Acidovorax sp. sic0104]|uniref:helix-turn-helix domain-containing protein n=1 Tax=Acidovorax sp. sic0104 TaxID=2854784 RepID=UPI001C44A262|nr:helix-turn-helix transcriptional regulator [Acidovorax sp. sic0104]MBV7542215.1 helix-turn-helix domain-containing protein [Acidovorax sp. sic0104]
MSEIPSNVTYISIGSRLAQERRRLGLTQAEFGGQAGLGRSVIGMIETGRTRLDLGALLVLESKVGVDVAFVLTGRRAAVAAADMLDWRLVEEILNALDRAGKRLDIELSPAGTARALRSLYRLASHEGRVSQGNVDDFVHLGAGLAA